MSQIELFNLLLGIIIIISYLKPYICGNLIQMVNSNTWNYSSMYKQMSYNLFRNNVTTNYLFTNYIYVYIYI